VDEDVVAAVDADEAEALVSVEPLHGSLVGHDAVFSFVGRCGSDLQRRPPDYGLIAQTRHAKSGGVTVTVKRTTDAR
jgi:hypothetical protein